MIKYLKSKDNLIYNVIFILSLLMIYPMYYFINEMLQFGDPFSFKGGDVMNSHNSDVTTSIYSFAGTFILKDYEYLAAFIFLIFNEILIIFLVVYFINKVKTESFFKKIFVYSSPFFGLGIFTFPLIFIKKSHFNIQYKNLGLIFVNTVISFSILLTTGLLISNAIVAEKYSQYSHNISNVNLSTQPGKENLILITLDSFDNFWTMPHFNNSAFKDFYYFPNFVTPGFYTAESEKIIYSEEIGNNLWDKTLSGYKINTAADVYTGLGPSKFKMLKKYSDYFNVTTINEDFSKYANNEFINEINIKNTKKYGNKVFNDDLPEKRMKNALIDNLKISNDPGMIFWSFYPLHNPYFGDEEGNFSITKCNSVYQSYEMRNYSSSAEFAYNATKDLLVSLKNSSDTFGSIYDNSMIVLFGDHSSHSNFVPNEYSHVGTPIEKNHSSLMIKYPHTSLAGDKPVVVDDIAIYAAHLQKIIDHYFANKNTDQIDWMRNNPNFAIDRKFLTYTSYWMGMYGYYTQFDSNGQLRIVESNSGNFRVSPTDVKIIERQYADEVGWK